MGGFAVPMTRHAAMYYPRGDTLIVTFDNMKSRDQTPPCYPWGHAFVEALKCSHLGIAMCRRNDWFRHRDLTAFFDDLAAQGFFNQFRDVVFYGSSMGGFGALTYCAYAPGARVVAFAPQSSLDPKLVPWETRFLNGRERGNWRLPNSDAAQAAITAREVRVFADPYDPLDRSHIQRLYPGNLTWYKCPSLGHAPAQMLKHAGLTAQALVPALVGDLSATRFHQIQRQARLTTPGIARLVMTRALERGHPDLVLRAADWAEARFPAHNFHRFRDKALALLEKPEAKVA